MNPKPVIFSGIIAITSLLAGNVNAQTLKSSDPGISTHNYKHSNKASLADKARLDGIIVPVSAPTTIEKSGNPGDSRPISQTPKYAASTYAFIVYQRQEKQKVDINPLISNRHYKTINPTPVKPRQEEWVSENI